MTRVELIATFIIRRHFEDNSPMMTSYGTTMMSAFSKHAPTFAPTSTSKQPSYDMPSLERRQEHFSDRRDELDIKIADVQLSYSQALDEVRTCACI